MNLEKRRPIALVGLSGSGKSVVAMRLAQRLGIEAVDLDGLFETEASCTIVEFFAREGEPSFRRREGELLARVLASPAAVVACGGGVVLEAAHRTWLRERCRTVWLQVRPETAAARTQSDATVRPLLASGPARECLAALLRERAELYAEVALARVPTDGRTVEQVADAVFEALASIEASGGASE